MGIGFRYKYITDDNPSYNSLALYEDFDGLMISIMAGVKFGFKI